MEEQLVAYAVERGAIGAMIGLGLRDEPLAERWWRFAQGYGVEARDTSWDLVSLSTRTLLWHGDPLLPTDGNPDGWWHGLQVLVAARATAVHAPAGMAVAADLDALYRRVEADDAMLPTRVSRRPSVPLPPPSYVDCRVIDGSDAAALARFYTAVAEPPLSPWALWLNSFAEGRWPRCDLWLFSPGLELLTRRPGLAVPPW